MVRGAVVLYINSNAVPNFGTALHFLAYNNLRSFVKRDRTLHVRFIDFTPQLNRAYFTDRIYLDSTSLCRVARILCRDEPVGSLVK